MPDISKDILNFLLLRFTAVYHIDQCVYITYKGGQLSVETKAKVTIKFTNVAVPAEYANTQNTPHTTVDRKERERERERERIRKLSTQLLVLS